jgi:hypothetical protein
MAQPSNRIVSSEQLSKADWRNQFLEVATSADDFASGECSLVLATVPFLPAGDNFVDIPLYPVGLAQSFAYNEGLAGQMVPEIGSSRKINTAGTAMGSGSISKLIIHGNSLVGSLYRPAIAFINSTETLSVLSSKLVGGGGQAAWIKGLMAQDVDLFSSELTDYVDRVIAQGGLNSILYKIPFGLVEVKRDPRQRVLAINFLEQCGLRGTQSGLNAGQFQMIDQLSFEFERVRPLLAAGPFSLSNDTTLGM